MSKLPNEIRLQVARHSTDEIWKIEDLLKTIKKEVEAREASEQVKTSEGRKSSFGKPPIPTASTLFAKQSGNPIRCVYCRELHYSASCEKVKDPYQRKEILVKERRCFNCLKPGHAATVCQNPRVCRHCQRRHHQSICPSLSNSRTDEKPSGNPPDEVISHTTTTNTVRKKGTVLLQTAKAVAFNEDNSKSTQVRILFDNGSQRSYVTSNLKSKLNLKTIKTETLNLNTFGGNSFRKQSCEVVKLRLRKHENEEAEITALNYPIICSPLPSKVNVNYPHLEDLQLADSLDDDSGTIDVLIGSDHYWDIVSGETVRGDSGPTAVGSKFGWLLSGPLRDSVTTDAVSSNLIISGDCPFAAPENAELTNILEKFWQTESIGIQGTKEDARQLKEEFVNIKHNGERYEVELPFKNDCLPIPDNYNLCYNRLKSMHFKLTKSPDVLREYDSIIQEQLASGIIEKVQNPETEEQGTENIHYLPHHAIVRQDRKTTKLRVVYDGSAKSTGQEHSLNDCLPTGPNYIPQLVDVLTRFRWNRIAISADIEKAFLMISIRESNRDMLRFLWLKDPFVLNSEIVQLRFCRLVFGLRPSPSILGATLMKHLHSYKEQCTELVELIKKSLYVDDLLAGANSVREGFEIYQQSKELLAEGGFNLRKWNSNSTALIQLINSKIKESEVQTKTEECETNQPINEEDESFTKSTIGPSQVPDQLVKTLGVCWDTASDEMLFDFTELIEYANTLQVTKRSLLKLTAKVFDPLGLLSPFMITMKCHFQSICLEKLDWDVELQGSHETMWKNFVSSLTQLNNVRVPRCYFNSSLVPTDIQIHAFSDASKKAYATAVYLRSVYEDEHVEVKLLASKTRVAPIKQQTIPRLELLGAVISARLVSSLLKSLSREIKPTFWVDSTTVLYWIKHEKPWKQYVQNRVQEIRQISPVATWNHCPGDKNPADLPSRGLSGRELAESTLWWNGPDYLKKMESEWPKMLQVQTDDEQAKTELVKNPPDVTHSLLNAQDHSTVIDFVTVIDPKKYSSLTRLLRISAYVLRFINNLKSSLSNSSSKCEKALSAFEINQAETYWIKAIQASSFKAEIDYLIKNSTLPPLPRVNQFGLYIDDKGVLRCKGRLNNADLPTMSKNPVLLPSKDDFVNLLIKDVHAKVKHNGVRDTLTTLREKYWVLRGREATKKVVKKCIICRKFEGVPFKPLSTPDLPDIRVADTPPFTHVGLDFAGPLYITCPKDQQSTEQISQKVYICLFTCATTRAVHLELTRDLGMQAFLQAFRRFSSRRGLPSTLISDNAKTFKAGSKEIQKIVRSQEVQRYLSNSRVTWKFIVEKAPWWGGFWERLIQSVKRCIKKAVGRTTLNYDEMNTLLVEVEGIINSRPLTYVYDDEESISHPLSPSQLISGRKISVLPNDQHFEIISTHNALTRRQLHHKHLLQQFAKQWKREYLLSLRENSKAKIGNGNPDTIAVGDIVIVKDNSNSRGFWKLAKVEELLPGEDGKVRAAIVKASRNNGKTQLLRRVVQHLIPIEVRVESSNNQVPQPTGSQVRRLQIADHSNSVNQRPRRNAAIQGEILRRELLNI